MALKVHLKIQERDIEVGRSFGNWILRWLDKMKPEAQIRGSPPPGISSSTNVIKQLKNNSSHLNKNNQGGLSKYNGRNMDKESDRHLFTAARNVWSRSFPTMSMTMKPSGHSNSQYRQYGTGGSELFTVKYGKFGSAEVLRNDIRNWIMQP